VRERTEPDLALHFASFNVLAWLAGPSQWV